jgi:hypothetical protein
MNAALRLLLAASLLACGGSPLPEPRILSVLPAQVFADEETLLVARVDAVAPFQVDYAQRSFSAETGATLSIGGTDFGPLDSQPGGLLVARLPPGLPVGAQDVRITLADGRSALAAGALQVAPARAIVAFAFDPIEEQQEGRTFPITVRAVGPEGTQFEGAVLLFDGADRPLSPPATGAFTRGVVTLDVTVNRNGSNIVLSARDGAGRVGFSNPFRVRPGN